MKREQRGFNLIELMIALVIGLTLIAAFVAVLARVRDQFATSESAARLADAGRHALSVVVPDLEHAGFYGFAPARSAEFLRGGSVLASGVELSQPSADELAMPVATRPVAGLPAGAHDCGANFAVDVSRAVQAMNSPWSFLPECAPTASAGGARAGTDTLTVRHAALAPSAPTPGRIQLYARRLDAFAPLTLFADGRVPGVVDSEHEVRDLEVRTYYVANSSVERPGWPALRVKALTESRGGAQFRDEEVLPGVEDLQVELGVESSEGGAPLVRFVPARLPEAGARVVAVRFWLRIRADSTEGGYRDERTLTYADASFTPTPLEATQRRMLLERTVALRNVGPEALVP